MNRAGAHASDCLLELERVDFNAGGATLLTGVDFTLEAGEFALLLGPNGAGKSTLLRLMARELAPSSGDIHLLGRPLTGWRASELAARRAVMPQDCPLTFPFTAAEVVALGVPPRLPAPVRRTVAQELMEWLEVAHLARRSYPSLSGGEQQRVQLARVLAQIWRSTGPRLLLLDEGTSALDPAHQYRIMAMLQTLAREARIGIIAACHDLPLAAAFSTRVLLLRNGCLVADGPPGHVLTRQNLSGVYDLEAEVQAGERPRIHIAGSLRPVPAPPPSLLTDG